ncbi:serine acetyltransferase [Verrucomicrobiales bacterium]|nr:serine acetyltransferase [Verrucomicrobiales bacterium]
MDCTHRNIVDSLVASYHEVGDINHFESGNLPSKRTIIGTCEQLLQVLFPGYHDEEPIPADELEMITGERIATIIETFEVEIAKSLRLRDEENGEHHEGLTAQAHKLVCQFLSDLPAIRQLMHTDVEAAYEGDPAAKNFDEIILAYPCIEAIAIQRCAHRLYVLDVPLIPRIMTEYAHSLTGIDIHPGAQIGSHFFIDHGTGVVIGETCVIGNYVKLYHGVTLGARNFPKDENGRIVKGIKRHPDVEDHVVVYPHATVLGGKTVIGKGSTIGANVFLRESIPADSFVTTVGEELSIFNKTTGEPVGDNQGESGSTED